MRRAPRNFALYSGDDATALALILLGGHGVISVTANVAPKLMHQMCAAALVGDVKKARELNLKLLPLHQRLFVESNPIPVKWALAQMGMIEHGLRLPLSPLAEKFHDTVREALADGRRAAGEAVAGGGRVRAGERLPHEARATRGRRARDRVGGEPRARAAGRGARAPRQGARPALFDFGARQVPHAPRSRL